MRQSLLLPLVAAALSSLAGAQVTVDGSTAGDGYTRYSTQTVNTQFGDNQSELNAAYARVTDGKLYLAITGNLEANFNKFELFIDARSGGYNTIPSSPGNDGSWQLQGLVLDSGFNPDFLVICRRGWNGSSSVFDIDFGELGTSNYDSFGNIFGGADFGQTTTSSGSITSGLEVAYNGSNSAGVSGGTGAADTAAAEAVTTGFEFGFDLDDLGWTGGDILVSAFVNSGDHTFFSNQFLGGLPSGTGNLGGTRDLTAIGGDQHFVIARVDAQVACSVTNHSGGFPAQLAAFGSKVASENDLGLRVTGLPTTGTTAYLFNSFLASGQSLSTVSSPSIGGTVAGGDVCIAGGTFGRHVFGSDVFMGTGGAFEITADLTALPSPRDGVSYPSPGHYSTAVLAGETWYWQCWFRDPTSGAGHSNFTEAISVTFQ